MVDELYLLVVHLKNLNKEEAEIIEKLNVQKTRLENLSNLKKTLEFKKHVSPTNFRESDIYENLMDLTDSSNERSENYLEKIESFKGTNFRRNYLEKTHNLHKTENLEKLECFGGSDAKSIHEFLLLPEKEIKSFLLCGYAKYTPVMISYYTELIQRRIDLIGGLLLKQEKSIESTVLELQKKLDEIFGKNNLILNRKETSKFEQILGMLEKLYKYFAKHSSSLLN